MTPPNGAIAEPQAHVAAVEARLHGRPVPEGLANVQAETSAMIGRMMGV